MSRKSIGEKRQSFSMRKLSVGLVSVTVASFFLMSQGIQSVSADNMENPIHYKYMTEGELTDEEKSLLVEAHLQLAEESDDTYYLGYIKTKKQDNAGISRTVDGKYSARSDSQPDSTKISDVVHSADSEWSQGQGKVSLQGEASGDDGLSEYTDPVATKGTQEPEHEGEAAVEEELPALEVTTRNRTEIQNIPYTTEEIQDPTLLKNRRKIERQGQAGTRTIQYEDYIVNGNVVETKEVSRTEVAPVNEVVKVGTLVKVKPTVEITNLTKVENKKSITVSYNLIDTTSAYVSAKTQVFHGDKLVKEVDIENPAKEQVISGLDYYTPYTVKTHLTYNLGENNEENTETSTQDFQLEYKKIEIKDIDSVELYGKENDRYRRYLSLSEAPTDTAKYFVKVKSDRFKEMYLPVKSITENTDGTYKVTVAVDQLVEEGTDGYKDDYTFTVAKSKAEQPGVYTSFKQLVTAMQSNLSGVYTLASDMTADEVSLGDKQTSYLTGAFTGSLIGSDGTKSYAIYDLKKPLFDTLNGATVRDLDIKTVSADSKENVAALAKAANSANINNVAVEGKISGAKSVAGLVASATNTVIENSSFTGKLIANHQDSNKNDTGGIVGNITGNSSRVNKVRVDALISTNARNNNQTAGGIVGRLENGALISNSVATGEIRNGQGYSRVGGIVGSTWQNGRVNNVVSNVDVGDGYVITGDQYAADVKNASTSVDNRKADRFATKLSKDQIDAKVADYGITVTLDDTGQDLKRNLREVDYTRLNKAEAERKVAYSNIEKLMPFYNKDLVVHYGNKVATTDKLYTTELLDVVPMKDDEVVTDINNKKNSINKVMLHFKDNTVEYLDVIFKENFINSQVIEYNVTGKEYIFTPEAFVSDYTAITNNVLSDLQNVTLNSEATKKVLGAANDAALDNLYLDRKFEEVKANIAEHLRKVLAMDKSINTTGDGVVEYVSEKIKNNKEAFMLGLTYMNRWYDINYGKMNTKDLSTYKFDFNGNNETSTLDTIIALGNSGLDNLRASNTVGLYANKLASVKGEDSVFDFVEAYRKLFLPNKTNNEWFKENTKAYIVEMKSDIAEVREKQESPTADRKYSLGVYDRISAPSWGHKSMLLPLLTLPEESVYISSNMSTLAFGSYERYRDSVDGVILSGDALRTYVRNRVDIAAKRHRDHYDIWYNLLDSASKEKLFRSVIVYDGFNVKDETGRTYWARLTDKNIGSIKEFFGPVGKWYEYNSSAGAYANGSLTHFVLDRLLDAYGTSVYTHEMVHNSDSAIYFEGNGRREGLGAELYALGLLQSVDSVNSHILALNTLYKAEKDDLNRLHTYNPVERFDSDEALQSYMHGSYDVMYTLDAMEAKAILAQNNDVKKKWFRKIENYYVRDTRHNKDTHAGNKVRPLTDEEVANLTSLNSLIDNDIINRRSYDDNREYKRNGYYTISMFSPVYAALSNSKGAPGDIMFRKIAYELLAEKGYHKGFLPYVSNQYGAEAFASGSKTFSSWHGRDVALVTDDLVFKKVFNGEYSSWADFKKAMFKQRIDKQDNLKPITIQYELGNPNSTKEVTITTAAQMQQLINEAAAKDITNIDRATSHTPASWVHLLKQKIYNAYLRTTDDFRNSIYK
ncbi:TPA: G5 domain-containing protein [Streptococcus pneumoniae]|nr:G5 domain-containing protein [Streptococcus pneumoniae]